MHKIIELFPPHYPISSNCTNTWVGPDTWRNDIEHVPGICIQKKVRKPVVKMLQITFWTFGFRLEEELLWRSVLCICLVYLDKEKWGGLSELDHHSLIFGMHLTLLCYHRQKLQEVFIDNSLIVLHLSRSVIFHILMESFFVTLSSGLPQMLCILF